MRRYLVFAGESYYPRGGWGDFRSDWNKLDFAIEAGTALLQNQIDSMFGTKANISCDDQADWFHITDTETGKICYTGFNRMKPNGLGAEIVTSTL